MAIVRKIIYPGDELKLSEEEKKEIEEAAKQPINYEDVPPLTDAQLAKMYRVRDGKPVKLPKPVVSLRISPETLEKAKETGKGYTGFLSRLLDNAIDDPEMVKKSL